MRDIKFENNFYYHIFNRGVEKRIIFLDDEDYIRFIYYLHEFNNINVIGDTSFKIRKDKIDKFGNLVSEKDKIVEIVCFALMPNHFHLLIKQIREKGVSLFMHKVSVAYAKYFNEKYERVGGLFQGTFKAKFINKDEYLKYLIYYILGNPIEIIEPRWKERGIKNHKNVKDFLRRYKWSSYRSFVGEKDFLFLDNNKNFVLEFFSNFGEFKQFINELIVSDKLNDIENLILE